MCMCVSITRWGGGLPQQYKVDMSSTINHKEVSVAQVGCTYVNKEVKVHSDTCLKAKSKIVFVPQSF